jgi:hypothetical protein
MKITQEDIALIQDYKTLLEESIPYPMSSPSSGKSTFHDFVKGLILSTNIIKLLIRHIPNGYKVDWGQIIIKNHYSKECDIIIYHGKPLREFCNQSMRYVLIEKDKANIVIQVKSSIQSVSKDLKEYCIELKKFVNQVWFIAECCLVNSENRANAIRNDLKKIGYNQSFFFYRRSDESPDRILNEKLFIDFIKLIRNLE